LAACEQADALAIMTPWPEFRQVPLEDIRAAMAGCLLLDPFGMVDRQRCTALGFRHFRLGTGPVSE
jgi:UDPglucose 6-dehydrogenase